MKTAPSKLLLALALLPLSACGDDGNDSSGADAGITADSGITIDADPNSPDAEPTALTAYALGSAPPASGTLARINTQAQSVEQDWVASVATNDSVLRMDESQVFVINRFGHDNISIIDKSSAQLVQQISTGSGSNPQDVAVDSNAIYVCSSNTGAILIFDRNNLNAETDSIDISSYDKDGVPNCSSILLDGDFLYIALQRLDENFSSVGGTILKVNKATQEVVGEINTQYSNPFSYLVKTDDNGAWGGDLLIATTQFSGQDGCIERIGLDPFQIEDCVIENSDLGGYVSVMAMRGDKIVAAVNTDFTASELRLIDAQGALEGDRWTSVSQQPGDLAVCSDGTVIANDKTTGGLFLFDSEGNAVNQDALDLGLPSAYANGILCE